mmetsp:Transcript_28609/g.39354  ORF Transcript_28609/g.39354 Transcript_28609/m.39354 type:complete len:253 (-) Transcript_28609:156-914(-)|eukprot:CAMPEP_0170088970 /NCGR_PEP_ID=MMETSP0019_2-20121128/23138_1 /TAXON_ID=98059 /ORGANISM="Dinobryon sp., Strain UTEXLB2267" /LENGTH=252 /DNA_ID=CAMNT_0010307533 /DNA_START=47 /DNA_END=805 /DNA_ORIENTATION=+
MTSFVESEAAPKSRRFPPGGRDSLTFGTEELKEVTIKHSKTCIRPPPGGGKVNVIFADEHTSLKSLEPITTNNNTETSKEIGIHGFDQSLHKSKSYQSNLFNEGSVQEAPSATKAAKKMLPNKSAQPSTLFSEVDTDISEPATSPRPAKKLSSVIDRSSMTLVMKPKVAVVKEEKSTCDKPLSIQTRPAGAYRVPTGFQNDQQFLSPPKSAKKSASNCPDRSSMKLVLSAVKPTPPSKFGISPGGPTKIFLG